jgi:predicted nucleotidyltransferase
MQRMNSAARIVADALPDAWAIYVFGSAARGDDTPESDLDLAVLLPPGSSIPDKLGLITDVAVAIGRDVEIVDLRRANLDLVHALLNEGRQLLVRREEETLVWEA